MVTGALEVTVDRLAEGHSLEAKNVSLRVDGVSVVVESVEYEEPLLELKGHYKRYDAVIRDKATGQSITIFGLEDSTQFQETVNSAMGMGMLLSRSKPQSIYKKMVAHLLKANQLPHIEKLEIRGEAISNTGAPYVLRVYSVTPLSSI